MSNGLFYDTVDCMKLIKKKYPLIPIFVIRRVLLAEELYIQKMSIINWKPELKYWVYKK